MSPKMENQSLYSFANGPTLTISNATPSLINPSDSIGQEENIIDLFNRSNKNFRRPRSISLNSHFQQQQNNEFKSNLSPLLMSTFKNSPALKLDQNYLSQEQFNNIILYNNTTATTTTTTTNDHTNININNNNNNTNTNNTNNNTNNPLGYTHSSLTDSVNAINGIYNTNSLSYLPPMQPKSADNSRETIPAQSSIKNSLFNSSNDQSTISPIIKKPTENVIQRYRRARTLSSPAVPPSVDKKNHFYSPFMTGLDIKYDFYIPKPNNTISPLSSSFTASDSKSFEMNREKNMSRRRSQSINEQNRTNINDF